eukprot:3869981-Rhodomonas_salina.1
MSGTDLAYGPTSLRACYAMSGTDLARRATVCYAMSGTDIWQMSLAMSGTDIWDMTRGPIALRSLRRYAVCGTDGTYGAIARYAIAGTEGAYGAMARDIARDPTDGRQDEEAARDPQGGRGHRRRQPPGGSIAFALRFVLLCAALYCACRAFALISPRV